MIILGIDPGTNIIGFGVIKYEAGRFECLDYGIIKNIGQDKLDNIRNTGREIQKLVSRYQPNRIGMEKLFFFKNQKTVMGVSEMRGAILANLAGVNSPIHEFTPLQVKQAVCNYGLADKKQVQKMVKMILKLKEDVKPDDAADALAVAICCATAIDQFQAT